MVRFLPLPFFFQMFDFILGGGFLFALSEFCLAFISHVRSQLEARGIRVGVAILAYSLFIVRFFLRALTLMF